MFRRKYTPSVQNNMKLKANTINELNGLFYRIDHGQLSTIVDQRTLQGMIAELRKDTIILGKTVGTGSENIENLAVRISQLVKELYRQLQGASLHRIQETIDDIDFQVDIWKDMLNGVIACMPQQEATERSSFTQRRLQGRLEQLRQIKDEIFVHSGRVEEEILKLEKDAAELDKQMIEEENERRINEIYRKITSLRSKIDALTVRKTNYITCHDLLDMIYVNVSEIVVASAYAANEIGKAKALLDMDRLSCVLSEPDKAVAILKRMQMDVQEVYNRVQKIEGKLGKITTPSITISEDAMNYKAELLQKKRNKEASAEIEALSKEGTSDEIKNNL